MRVGRPNRRGWISRVAGPVAGVVGALLFVGVAVAAGPIVLDGLFGDWAGHPNVPDPQGDAYAAADVVAFFFDTNPNEETAYFMAERVGSNRPQLLLLRVDTNNNGVYTDPQDRAVVVFYRPLGNRARVNVVLTTGTGQFLNTLATNADWGESIPEGGRRVEWGVTFADLGILPGQTIRMRLMSTAAVRRCFLNGELEDAQEGGDELAELLEDFLEELAEGEADVAPPCVDFVNEVQWSPANALGRPLVAVLAVAGALLLAWQRSRTP